MSKYLVQASYTADGVKGLAKDTASGRRAAVVHAIESLGGKLENMYFSFGEYDVLAILDLPDNAAAARFALRAASTGQVSVKTTPLLTPEEVDKALLKTVDYRAPGEAR
ncbi:MAG TPA: GYD domain-containing protein [Stellaceae bacterium]|nr:GYD domain-containing protein [Stellaceae bacterium]